VPKRRVQSRHSLVVELHIGTAAASKTHTLPQWLAQGVGGEEGGKGGRGGIGVEEEEATRCLYGTACARVVVGQGGGGGGVCRGHLICCISH
jgi:hypothetical protein